MKHTIRSIFGCPCGIRLALMAGLVASPAVLRAAGNPPAAVHEVDRGIVSASWLLEGGRKLIRHDCPEGPDNLEAAYLNDTAGLYMTVRSALSRDDGATWSPAGPLGPGLDGHAVSPALGFCGTPAIAFAADTALFLGRDDDCQQTWPTVRLPGCGLVPVGLQQALALGGGGCASIYWSFSSIGGGNPYPTWFRRSTDGGTTWSACVNFTERLAVPDGFVMAGMDGALSMAARGDTVAALAAVALDPAWASAHGFRDDVAYPALTVSLDGGETWSALRLPWGTDASDWPHGHSGDADFDSSIVYTGGMGPGLGFTASRYLADNVAITADGRIHFVYTLNDTSRGYSGVFHTLWENGTLTHAAVGFPEDSTLADPLGAGIADRPSIAVGPGDAVVVGWTESTSPNARGDVCYNVVPPGEVEGAGPVNVTRSPDDDEFAARLVDRVVPVAPGADSVRIDWLFVYLDPSTGMVRDSTLHHLQTRAELPPPAGRIGGPPDARLPRGAALRPNAPNPFNPSTTVRYRLDAPTRVTVRVFDLRGRRVRTLVDGPRVAGEHAVVWDGRDARGGPLPSGIYLSVLETEAGFRASRKMVLLK